MLNATATGNVPSSLTYGMTDIQVCNVMANIQHRVEVRHQVARHAVTTALIEERGYENTMPNPSPRQMSDLITFAKSLAH